MIKTELRKLYKQKRKELSNIEVTKLQENIYQQTFTIDYSLFQNIHIFLPIEKQRELDTYPIINFLRKYNKKIIISKSNFTTHTLDHFIFNTNTHLNVNKHGISEPKNAQKINVLEIDLVFVPLLISDEKNFRIGYGKGFYDRFLNNCKKDIKTIGLNFFPPIKKIEDTNEFDIPLGTIIYPK